MENKVKKQLSDLPHSFVSRVEQITESGCWIWLGGVHSHGYGTYSRRPNKPILAHRFAYLNLKGSIPEPLQLDHLCRVRLCVNPDHLETVTRRENILRGVAPSAIYARRTHCAEGHPLVGENLMLDSGHRRCMTCRTEYERLRNLRRYQPHPRPTRTHCKLGHALEPDNIFMSAGHAICRVCYIVNYHKTNERQRLRRLVENTKNFGK